MNFVHVELFLWIRNFFGSLRNTRQKRLNRPLSHCGHVESQGNKKLCFRAASLALNSRLAEACRLLRVGRYQYQILDIIDTEVSLKNIDT